eukprot:COSAG02_NODE_12293_length_1566_cov_18.984985_2_plen_68_part_01
MGANVRTLVGLAVERQGRGGAREPLGEEPLLGSRREVTERLFDRARYGGWGAGGRARAVVIGGRAVAA